MYHAKFHFDCAYESQQLMVLLPFSRQSKDNITRIFLQKPENGVPITISSRNLCLDETTNEIVLSFLLLLIVIASKFHAALFSTLKQKQISSTRNTSVIYSHDGINKFFSRNKLLPSKTATKIKI